MSDTLRLTGQLIAQASVNWVRRILETLDAEPLR